MPSAWKKAKLGEVPRLLASGARRAVVGDSPLVVQVGFPTSVADLVVKNHGRLRTKTPRWLRRRRRSRPDEAEAGCSAVASIAPEVPADAPLPPQDEEDQRSPVAAGVETRRGAGVISGEGPGSSLRKEDEAAAAAAAAREPGNDALQAMNSSGFVMPRKVAFLVLVLAMGTQTIALGASISAFAILLLESMGWRLIPSPKPCEESKKKRLGTVARVASVPSTNARMPVKNFAAFRERGLESKLPVEVPPPVPALEPKDRVGAEGSRGGPKWSTSNKKAKKLLKQLLPKKLRSTEGEKGGKSGAKAEPASDCSIKGASGQRGEGEEPLGDEEDGGAGGVCNVEEDDDEEEGGVLGIVVTAGARDAGVKDAAFLGESVGETASGGSGHLVFFLVVLFGLAGGRSTAMALTVGWYLLVSSARGLWQSWRMQQKPVKCEMLPSRKL